MMTLNIPEQPEQRRRRPSNAARMRFAEQIEKLASEANPVTREWVRVKFGHQFLATAQCVEWAIITTKPDGTMTFSIDRELRDICEGKRSRPELNGFNFRDWFKNLRDEIKRRRKENNDAKINSRWQPEAVLKLKQSELFDYIESQLDLIVGLV